MIIFVRAFAGLLLAGALATAASAQTKWDMPTPYPDGNFHTKNIAQFAADVDKATGGSLTIAVHSAGSLIKHPEIKRAVRQGTAPIGEILESLAANEAPVYGLDSLPFLATGYDGAKKLYAAQKPYLEKQRASEGLVLLFSVPWPPQGLYAKREIKSVDDLKGLNFRTYNALTGRLAALAGAIPTQIEVPDLPTAFATGRVDVMITSASTGVDTKAQDYLTHYIDTQAWLPRDIVIVNKEAFDKLSAAEKKALTDAAKVAEERGWKASIEETTIKTDALKQAKIVHEEYLPTSTTDFTAGAQRLFDALKDKPGRRIIFIIWAGAGNPFKIADLDPKRYGIEIATGGNILPAMAAYKNFPGMEGATYYYFGIPKNRVNEWLVANHYKKFRTPPDFFTAGGMAAGIAVLDVIDEDGLQENSKVVGKRLKDGLTRLMAEHDLIGDVRGMGLMLGVEFVRDRATKEPAKAETLQILEEARAMGVLLGKGGIDGNVIRIKPPMCITAEDADYALEVLHRALQSTESA